MIRYETAQYICCSTKDNILTQLRSRAHRMSTGSVLLERLMPVCLSGVNPAVCDSEQFHSDWQLLSILIHKHKQQSA